MPKKILGIIGVIIVAVVVVSVAYFAFFASAQSHVGFISEKKAESILKMTFNSEATETNPMGMSPSYFSGSSSANGIVFSGTMPKAYASVFIEVVHYNTTGAATSFYAKQVIKMPVLSTINATYRGYDFSYQYYANISGRVVSGLNAWCLLKNYVILIGYMPYTLNYPYSNATVLSFVHAQMDAML